ncbi:MAG: alpha-1,4-glucan--maltose-1-phosphate maltosyltransferase [Actinomycetota bacterium]|nr:alpha-1,4-glucan--maltose-1-phosphate maltosyltransferase [Actinomycetota bacterium]MDQ2956420.1 alpha-1,4-glucan--maltose-1-phosphate maltosyltransferase [Actinomycetota bacterium]
MAGRLGLNSIHPVIAHGELPARAVIGEPVGIEATVFREGHDAVAASVVWRSPEGAEAGFNRMRPLGGGTDRWRTEVVADRTGSWTFLIEAWSDPLATWYHAVQVKADAGQDADELANDLEVGARLFEQLAEQAPDEAGTELVGSVVEDLRRTGVDLPLRITRAMSREVRALARDYPIRELITRSPRYHIWVDRERALYGAWYEFFPRSIGAEFANDPDDPARPARHGTLVDATEHLDYVADLGFDVVYLPPIHPIGRVNRKGPNNTLDAKPTDTGSPWAIGSPEGGHDAIHPELGDEADFAAFVARTRELGMEVALDLALQCAPDHPWVDKHPEWFTTLPDNTIAYAENPPKKYQDIYPLNFDNDPAGLAAEVLRITMLWVSRGVKIFRVDNPHTKPLSFWQWLIGNVKATEPDVLFLAEAFTRPAMMHELARIGFTQSYTYFTWRNTAWELQQYGEELVAAADYMRPNFFPNTPDILNEFLVDGGPSAFALRLVLASMISPSYGIYSGYELYENAPVRPGSEEYLNSEKYQLRPRDLTGAITRGESLAPFMKRLNEIRRAHPALHQLRNLRFHYSESDALLAFSKRDAATGDTILVVCTTDPHNVREGWIHLRLDELGVGGTDSFAVSDLLSGANYEWGEHNFVRLSPDQVAHVFTVRPSA